MTDLEVRLLTGCEVRAADEGAEKALAGRVAPYGTWAPIGGRYEESFAPGVFAKSIRESAKALPLLLNHRHGDLPIGRAVEWEERADGLHGRWLLADTDEARKAHALAVEGFLSGLSTGFIRQANGDDVELHAPPQLNRITRRQARLAEVSLVSVPAYADAVLTNTRTSLVEVVSLTPHRNAWAEWLDGVRKPVRIG